MNYHRALILLNTDSFPGVYCEIRVSSSMVQHVAKVSSVRPSLDVFHPSFIFLFFSPLFFFT